ncbi:NADH-ubiquinone oxidoreductase chain N [hydrothermal vent metagenome]|uniref:NADH-ubiquinone oxidoreductase chain N n=1 Tax=hydrothermal vent metagenome TaxID=652676 RepID=A0A3B1CQ89_9ZZZZ
MTDLKIPDIALGAIVPEITLTVVACILLMLEVFASKKGKDMLAYVALGGVLVAAILTHNLNGQSFGAFSGLYAVDNFSTFFKLVMLLATGLTILISNKYNQTEGIDNGEYYALLLFTTVGMFFMASGKDLITIFIGLEVMSISLYVLVGYTRSRRISNEASLKYFILGSLSSGIMLYGMALVYGATGTTKLVAIGKIIAASPGNVTILTLGAVLLTVGFGFKVAAAPFHLWTPDVYQGAPAPIAAFMSAGPKAAAFAAFIRVFAEALPSMKGDWWEIIWILAVITMTLGNVAALMQSNVKRMLAYSSIAHAGYILVGLVAASERGVSSILFYLLAYTFMNIGAFAVVAIVAGKGEERVTFDDFAGLGYKYPLMSLSLTIFLFSLAGLPPTAGFVGKFYIFMSALDEGLVWLAIIGVLNSVVSVFYYLRLTVVMYMREESADKNRPALSFAPSMVVALILSIYGVMWLGIMPSSYVAFAKSAFLSF